MQKVFKKRKEIEGFYKGYYIKWLEKNPDHPDYYLLEEYKKKK